MTTLVVIPDIRHIKDANWYGPLPALLAPYVKLCGPLHIYENDITGHLFIRTGNADRIAGAEHIITLRPSPAARPRGARIY